MNADLSALPQPVRDALDEIDDCMRMDIKVVPVGALGVIRAELLRLTGVAADLTFADNAALKRANERARKAESELAALRKRVAGA